MGLQEKAVELVQKETLGFMDICVSLRRTRHTVYLCFAPVELLHSRLAKDGQNSSSQHTCNSMVKCDASKKVTY